jgi:twitching motility protein PilT
MAEVDRFLKYARDVGASDLHLHPQAPPIMRVNGILRRLKYRDLTAEDTVGMLKELLADWQMKIFEEEWELDFAHSTQEGGRCRACACTDQNGVTLVFRLIPPNIHTLTELGFPSVVQRLLEYRQGMILVTGRAGCGKSTTLAAMVEYLNATRSDHIICLEDPIEYLFTSKKCHIMQREVGRHTESFARALRACLREDPDVIIVGEMRDLETISQAITAAETGHLVLATLHTTNAARTIGRVLDVFPPNQQDQIRTMLSESLRGIISQQLMPTVDGGRRVVAVEVMVCTPAIANLIREDRCFQIPSQMQTGAKLGMRLMDDSILEMLQRNIISPEIAIERAHDPSKFRNVAELRRELVDWEEFQLLRDGEKRKVLRDKGVILWDHDKRRPKGFRRESVPFRFFHKQPTRLPEEDIYAEVIRLFPEAEITEDAQTSAPKA